MRSETAVQSLFAETAGVAPEQEVAQMSADWAQGRREQAAARAQALLAKFPKASEPHNVLGVVAAARGEVAQARAHFSAAAEGAPRSAEGLHNLAKLQASHGEPEAALDTIARLVAEFEGRPTAPDLAVWAEASLLLGDVKTATERALDAIARAPDDLTFLRLFAKIVDHSRAVILSDAYFGALTRVLSNGELISNGAQRASGLAIMEEIRRQEGDEVRVFELNARSLALLKALLFHSANASVELETVLVPLRARLLAWVMDDADAQGAPRDVAEMLEAMARHSHTNEFIWDETAEETARLERLQQRVEHALSTRAPVKAAELFALGAYRDLANIEAVRDWVEQLAELDPRSVDPTLELLVYNAIYEAKVRENLPSLTPISEGVSSAVRAQYEENPYPRWRKIGFHQKKPIHVKIMEEVRPNPAELPPVAEAPMVLVAGCGTGKHPIGVARIYEGAKVLGVDLSRASLAYGFRQAVTLGVDNVSFAHADILRLEGLDGHFDVVEASGVIHHMKEPEEGLKRLVAALKPGGYLNLGLYSAHARQAVSKARAFIAERGYASDLAGIRAFRRDYLQGAIEAIGDLTRSRDFFHTSDLRDLVFHVQEHQLTLPEVAGLLERNGLEFLGFIGLPERVKALYAEETPQDPAQTDLALWDAFEQRHPDSFIGMYQFWSRKR